MLVSLAASLGACAPARPKPPRGILVLLVDCLRADHLGLQGSERPTTPSIDAWGSDSVLFRSAWAQASWTRPSVPTLLTGLYPSEHGLTDFVESGRGVRGAVLAPEVTTLAEGMKAAGYRTALVGYQVQLSPRFGMDQGFDFFNNNTMGAQRIDNRFLGWLDESPEQPYFAYLHYLDIHWPYCPPPDTFGRFDPSPDALRLCDEWRALRERIRSGELVLGPAERRTIAARYAEELVALDAEIGRLAGELERRGVWDETLVVLTSDHGEELAERGMIEHGHTMHDELLHVPFLWKLPKSWRRVSGARGSEVDALIETRSLLPTLFDLVGQSVPESVSAPSLLPWVLGRPPGVAPYERIVAEANGMFAVRTVAWKLIETPNEKKQALYDLTRDPGETRDVAAEHPDVVRRLHGDLLRWKSGLRPQRAATAALDDETVKALEALGYM